MPGGVELAAVVIILCWHALLAAGGTVVVVSSKLYCITAETGVLLVHLQAG